jgi:F0F1-type ATP synthase membrane subunit b/b'
MQELLQDVLHEITGDPVLFAAEVLQFLLLLVIIRFLLRRVAGKDLRERRERIAAELEKAGRADAAYADAGKQAEAIMARAREEAQRVREHAVTTAGQERRAGQERIEREAAAIVLQAEQSIEADKNKAVHEASEQLVELVGQVTRRFLEEALTESERRALMQKLILARLQEMEKTASQP